MKLYPGDRCQVKKIIDSEWSDNTVTIVRGEEREDGVEWYLVEWDKQHHYDKVVTAVIREPRLRLVEPSKNNAYTMLLPE